MSYAPFRAIHHTVLYMLPREIASLKNFRETNFVETPPCKAEGRVGEEGGGGEGGGGEGVGGRGNWHLTISPRLDTVGHSGHTFILFHDDSCLLSPPILLTKERERDRGWLYCDKCSVGIDDRRRVFFKNCFWPSLNSSSFFLHLYYNKFI